MKKFTITLPIIISTISVVSSLSAEMIHFENISNLDDIENDYNPNVIKNGLYIQVTGNTFCDWKDCTTFSAQMMDCGVLLPLSERSEEVDSFYDLRSQALTRLMQSIDRSDKLIISQT